MEHLSCSRVPTPSIPPRGELIEGALLLLFFLLIIGKESDGWWSLEKGGEQRCRRHMGGGEREGIPAGTGDEDDISAVVCCGSVL